VSTPPNDPRVDELRQRLRSLGYLDAGVDRFVLGPATGARRPASLAFLSSLRIGVLAALLLAPAATIGLSARMPNLVTGPRDALVVALYLGAFFGLAAALAAFIAGVIVARVSRTRFAHGNRLPRFIRPNYVGPHKQFLFIESAVLPLGTDPERVDMLMLFVDFLSKVGR